MADITPDEKPLGATHNEKAAATEYSKGDLERDSSSDEKVNLSSNLSARIKNPLAHMTDAELMADVSAFAKRTDLVDMEPMLRKGAFVARNPGDFEQIDGLEDDEREVLRNEILHKWRQPRALYFTVILCSIGAAVQGWDQTGSNGANISWPLEFGIPDGDETDPNYERNAWLVGLVNAAPYISSAFVGAWLADPINNAIGRRGCIFFSAIFCLLAPIGSALTQNWWEFFIARLLLGIGMGAKATVIPPFCAENVPAVIRGGLVMSWQMWTAFGIFLGTVANLAVGKVGAIAWRLQVGSAFIPALPLLIGIYFCPESPRWLMSKGRYKGAYRSLTILRNHPIQAARDLYYIDAQLKVEAALIGETSFVKRFMELFTIPRVRRATLASGTVMLAQQMCGINIIAFFSTTLFKRAGWSDFKALWASFGFGLVNWVFAFPAVITIDTFGRRNLLLFTFPNMAWTLLAAGFCFWIPEGSSARLPLIAFFIYLFAAFYSPGEGPVPFTYSAECFPITHRSVGMAWAVATCLFWAAVLNITFFRILQDLKPQGAFGLYAGFNVIALVMIFFWVPETKQRTLEELDYVFAVPTSRHMSYQARTWLPYFVKRYILRKKVTLEPLYHFEGQIAVEQERNYSVVSEHMSQGKKGRFTSFKKSLNL